MKPPRPLLCRVVRFHLEVIRDLPPERSRHVARCPHCQAHYAFLARLEAAGRLAQPRIEPDLAAAKARLFAELACRDARARRPPTPRLAWQPRLALALLILGTCAYLVSQVPPSAPADYAAYARKVGQVVGAAYTPRAKMTATPPATRSGD